MSTETKRTRAHAYYLKNKERINKAQRAYNLKNKATIRAQKHAHYAANKTAINQAERLYRKLHPEHCAKVKRTWAADNPGLLASNNKRYHTKHREKLSAKRRLIKHNVSGEKVNTMLDRQGFQCAICRHPDGIGGGNSHHTKRLAIDHCHYAGHVRGMLCDRCNLGLGFFRDVSNDRDSITTLQNAIQYLLDHQEVRE